MAYGRTGYDRIKEKTMAIENTYKMADRVIRICSLYSEVHDYCRDYLFDGTPDFTVTTTAEDIESERRRSERCDIAGGREIVNYTDSYLEELAVYRGIAEKMPHYDTFLFHGSAVAVDGQCCLFAARSGTGKSTHTRLWRELLGDRAVMVNDDKPLIRVDDGGVTVFGTPYNGKHRLGGNISAPLKAVCLLDRSEDNHISKITKEEACTVLLRQTYRPEDRGALAKTLELLDRMSVQTEFWRLGCNMDISAAELAYNAMKG